MPVIRIQAIDMMLRMVAIDGGCRTRHRIAGGIDPPLSDRRSAAFIP